MARKTRKKAAKPGSDVKRRVKPRTKRAAPRSRSTKKPSPRAATAESRSGAASTRALDALSRSFAILANVIHQDSSESLPNRLEVPSGGAVDVTVRHDRDIPAWTASIVGEGRVIPIAGNQSSADELVSDLADGLYSFVVQARLTEPTATFRFSLRSSNDEVADEFSRDQGTQYLNIVPIRVGEEIVP